MTCNLATNRLPKPPEPGSCRRVARTFGARVGGGGEIEGKRGFKRRGEGRRELRERERKGEEGKEGGSKEKEKEKVKR